MEHHSPHSDDIDWNRLLIEVKVLANFAYRRYLIHVQCPILADDLAQEAIYRYLNEVRKCPNHVDLLAGLNGIIRSIAGHELEKTNNRLQLIQKNLSELEYLTPIYDGERAAINQLTSQDLIRITLSTTAIIDRHAQQIITESIMDSNIKGKELANKLQVKVRKIYKLNEKLRKMGPEFLLKHFR